MRFSAAFMPLLPLSPLRKSDRAASPRRNPVITPALRPLPEVSAPAAAPVRQLIPELLLDLDQRVRLSGEW